MMFLETHQHFSVTVRIGEISLVCGGVEINVSLLKGLTALRILFLAPDTSLGLFNTSTIHLPAQCPEKFLKLGREGGKTKNRHLTSASQQEKTHHVSAKYGIT